MEEMNETYISKMNCPRGICREEKAEAGSLTENFVSHTHETLTNSEISEQVDSKIERFGSETFENTQ
ncbi:hypothetical protein AVEN_263037-1, partial [Araneus ventricosus]